MGGAPAFLSAVRFFALFALLLSGASGIITASDREFVARVDRYMKNGGNRPPGKLLLNMLIKNEEEHLKRTLPQWAKVADYWIIGVDDANTDNSEKVIKKYLGHLPGEIVTVHFDGMGPTWTQLVEVGVRKYPAATHGIISDADFMPTNTFDKNELDVRCSKHMFQVVNADRTQTRNLDWIYRNLPGAKVKRRTHQSVEGPHIPNQEVTQTLISLQVEEQPGGFQDRTPGKHKRYISWLMKDLEEMPNDPRTIYYLGHGFYDVALAMPQQQYGSDEWKNSLQKALYYFSWRGRLRTGYYEERWQALIKEGEIHERFFHDYSAAKTAYDRVIELDPDRADGWFYMAQLHRLHIDPAQGLPYVRKAVSVPLPQRSIHNWFYLYDCLVHQEYLYIATAVPGDISAKEWKSVRAASKKALAHCQPRGDVERAVTAMEEMAAQSKRDDDEVRARTSPGQSASSTSSEDRGKKEGKELRRELKNSMRTLSKVVLRTVNEVETEGDVEQELYKIAEAMDDFVRNKPRTCSRFNSVVTPFLRLLSTNSADFEGGLETELYVELLSSSVKAAALCRD